MDPGKLWIPVKITSRTFVCHSYESSEFCIGETSFLKISATIILLCFLIVSESCFVSGEIWSAIFLILLFLSDEYSLGQETAHWKFQHQQETSENKLILLDYQCQFHMNYNFSIA